MIVTLNNPTVVRLYQLIPCDNIDKPHYLTSGLKWSSSGSPVGHPRLHQHIAYGLWQMRKYPEARQHFLQSSDGQGCGHMLVEFHQRRGFTSELFIGQTVIQYPQEAVQDIHQEPSHLVIPLPVYSHGHPRTLSWTL